MKRDSPFELTRGIERRFALKLRKLAFKIGDLIDRFDPLNDPTQVREIDAALNRYSIDLTPWAKAVAARVVSEVDHQNRQAYARHSQEMSRNLRRELLNAPTGDTVRRLQAEQVTLIKSLPTEAAARVQRIAIENMVTGERSGQLAKMLKASGHVTASRANLIARTETAKASSNLTQARAVYVGSDDYYWRTARDDDVRESHRRMEGVTVNWRRPPTLDGLTGHAGCLPNCRCYPEPIIPLD